MFYYEYNSLSPETLNSCSTFHIGRPPSHRSREPHKYARITKGEKKKNTEIIKIHFIRRLRFSPAVFPHFIARSPSLPHPSFVMLVVSTFRIRHKRARDFIPAQGRRGARMLPTFFSISPRAFINARILKGRGYSKTRTLGMGVISIRGRLNRLFRSSIL